MYSTLLKKIKKYNKITIYRHQRPDGDATFSSFALYNFLIENFPEKEVELYGKETYDLLPYKNVVSKEFISESLVIILDSANTPRIDDSTYSLGKEIVKIDHHPSVEEYGDLNIVEDNTCATCELLAKILFSKPFSQYNISTKVCEYLYCGILTDSLGFKTSNTTSNTLLIASKLIEKGNLDISALNNYVFNVDLALYKKTTKFRNELKIKNSVGYIIANEKKLKELKMTCDEAKNRISDFGSIKGLKSWCIFVYNSKTKKYDGSLRSQKKYIINELASKYNGGGHKNACGVKNLTLKQVKELIFELEKIVK